MSPARVQRVAGGLAHQVVVGEEPLAVELGELVDRADLELVPRARRGPGSARRGSAQAAGSPAAIASATRMPSTADETMPPA